MRVLASAGLALLLGTVPTLAVDVDFTGTVSALCSLTADLDGTLALSSGGDQLSSAVAGGSAGSVTILSIGTGNTIEVEAPTRTSAPPAGYSTGTEEVAVSYSGAGGLNLVTSGGFVTGTTTFDVDTIPASVLTVHNRISNTAGFPPGTYATETIITCLP